MTPQRSQFGTCRGSAKPPKTHRHRVEIWSFTGGPWLNYRQHIDYQCDTCGRWLGMRKGMMVWHAPKKGVADLDRLSRILELRNSGLSQKAIGQQFGISTARVGQLVSKR